MKYKHIVQIYLEHISFSFTRSKLKDLIQDNPLSDTFWGIKGILKEYNIDSKGFKMSQLDDILSLPAPFIVQLKNTNENYALLTKVDENEIEYKSVEGIYKKNSLSEFLNNWTGMVLYPEVTSHSKENHLQQNKVNSFLKKIRIPTFVSVMFLFIILLYIRNIVSFNLVSILLLLYYILGISLCVGLMIQEVDKDNPFVKKICQINKKANCVGVMESKGSKLFGLIGWSEIGFVYFSGSLLVLILFPSCYSFLFWIHVFSLPYTVWSVLYQWKVAKAWCTLCLYVQLILWLIFFTFLFDKLYLVPFQFHLDAIINFLTCYVFPATCLWFVFPFIKQSYQFPFVSNQLKRIKSNDDVFYLLLQKQKTLILEPSARNIVFGNTNAPFVLTVINNPYCHHCATMHKRLNSLLQKYKDQIKVEMIFIGNEYSQDVIKFLISVYYQYDKDATEKIYSDWFEKKEDIFKEYSRQNLNASDYANTVYIAQKKWKDETKVILTPSIYINDYELPEGYQLEDIIYFI